MSDLNQNVGGYLIQRLYTNGVRHMLGVSGDFVLGFYPELIQSNKLRVINNTNGYRTYMYLQTILLD